MDIFTLKARIELSTEALKTKIKSVSTDLDALATKVGASFKTAGENLTKVGGGLTAGITAPIGLATAALVQAGTEFEAAQNTIRVGTGATGTALDALTASFSNVARTVPQDSAAVATAIADLNTFTGATGTDLEALATSVLNLTRITGEPLETAIRNSARVFGDWGIVVDQQATSLDAIFKNAQSFGISVTTLEAQLVQFGAPLRAFGFSFEEAATLLASFEKAGINTEIVMSGLRTALGKFSKEGITDVKAGLTDVITSIQNAETAGAATAIAIEAFGQRAGPDLAIAAKEGKLSIDDLVLSIQNSDETIAKAAADTITFKDQLAQAGNAIRLALAPLGAELLVALEAFLPKLQLLALGMGDLISKFLSLPGPIQNAILVTAAIAAALGPLLVVIGQISVAISALTPLIPLLGAAFAALTGPVGLAVAAIVALIAIFANDLGGIRTKTEEVIAATIAKIQELGPAALVSATELIDNLVNTLSSNAEKLKAASLEAFNNIWSELKLLPARASSLITDVVSGIASSFTSQEAISTITTALNSVSSSMLSALAISPEQLAQIGKDVIDGLITGIRSNVANLRAFITNEVAGALPTWVKSALKIESPSRVFSEIGLNIVQGLEKGLRDNIALPLQAVRQLVVGVLAEFNKLSESNSDLGRLRDAGLISDLEYVEGQINNTTLALRNLLTVEDLSASNPAVLQLQADIAALNDELAALNAPAQRQASNDSARDSRNATNTTNNESFLAQQIADAKEVERIQSESLNRQANQYLDFLDGRIEEGEKVIAEVEKQQEREQGVYDRSLDRQANQYLSFLDDRIEETEEDAAERQKISEEAAKQEIEDAKRIADATEKLTSIKEALTTAIEKQLSPVEQVSKKYEDLEVEIRKNAEAAGYTDEELKQLLSTLGDARAIDQAEAEFTQLKDTLNTVTTVASAVSNGLNAAFNIDFSNGNSIIDGAAGIADAMSAIPGPVGAVAGAVSSVLKSVNAVIGDLANGAKAVREEIDSLNQSSSVIDFNEIVKTTRVSRGGVAGFFGFTKQDIDREASALGLSIATTLSDAFDNAAENGFSTALRGGDVLEAMKSDILNGLEQVFTESVTSSLQVGDQLKVDMTEVARLLAEGNTEGANAYVDNVFAGLEQVEAQLVQAAEESGLALRIRTQEVVALLKDGFGNAVTSAFELALAGGSEADILANLSNGVREAVKNSVVQAMLDAVIINGALAEKFEAIGKAIASGNFEAVDQLLAEIDAELPKIVETLEKGAESVNRIFSTATDDTAEQLPEKISTEVKIDLNPESVDKFNEGANKLSLFGEAFLDGINTLQTTIQPLIDSLKSLFAPQEQAQTPSLFNPETIESLRTSLNIFKDSGAELSLTWLQGVEQIMSLDLPNIFNVKLPDTLATHQLALEDMASSNLSVIEALGKNVSASDRLGTILSEIPGFALINNSPVIQVNDREAIYREIIRRLNDEISLVS